MKHVTLTSIFLLSLSLSLTGCGSDGGCTTGGGTQAAGGCVAPSETGWCSDPNILIESLCEGEDSEGQDRVWTEPSVIEALASEADCVAAGGTWDEPTVAGTDAGTTEDTTSGGGGGGVGCELDEPLHSAPPETLCDGTTCECGTFIQTVRGKVVDSEGTPLAGAKAQVCSRSASDGGTVCLPPVDTAADGTFTLTVPPGQNCMYETVMRALVANEAYSTYYCTITGDDLVAVDGVLDLTGNPAVLYATTPLLNPPPIVVDTDDDGVPDDYEWGVAQTVMFEGGLEIDVVANKYFNSALGIEPMAARWIEGTDHLCDVAAIEGAPGVWAISPEGDAFETTFPARIPAAGLADGTEVKLFIEGGIGLTKLDAEGEKEECGEGVWTHFACATVEGGMVTLEWSAALPAISALAFVPAE